jgi:hypothetical protein
MVSLPVPNSINCSAQSYSKSVVANSLGDAGRTDHACAAHIPTRAIAEQNDATGWPADVLEVQAFACLAVRRLRGSPNAFPTTTGAPRPLPGGVVIRP